MLPEDAPLISVFISRRFSVPSIIGSASVILEKDIHLRRQCYVTVERLSASEESVTCDDLPKNKVKTMDCSNGSLRLLTNYYEPTTSRTKTEVL